jgi:serine protease AprX
MLQASVALPSKRLQNRTRARLAVLAVVAFLLPPGAAEATRYDALVPAGLANAAKADPGRSFRVIVQGDGVQTPAVADAVAAEIAANPGKANGLRRRFSVISGVAAELTGRQILALAHRPSILAITPDSQLQGSDLATGPTPVSAPTIAGDAVEGGTLSATIGSWTGTAPITYAYQWQFCDAALTCSDIAGETAASLVVPAGAAGSLVRAVVTATDATGASASAPSGTLAIVAAPSAPPPPPPPAPVPPVAYAPPAVMGAAQQGAVLTASDGSWTASAPVSITYQWQSCDSAFNCVDIEGAKSSSYTPVLGDVGSALRVVVTATSVDGSASAPSDPTPAIRPLLYGGVWSSQIWPYAAGLPSLWEAVSQTPAPAIAVVDSGIDPGTPDVAGRIVDQVTITQSSDNSPGDGRGHGTLVASLAAGNANGRAGAAPGAKLVSLDVLDDQGMAQTSDVIAAADWIYQHKDDDGIRVANFSLTGSVGASFQFDPLDRALERLWLSGVVVVAAAGNYAVNGQPSGVPFAPGNDPLVITVGADDTVGTASPGDDVAAPWSAFGSTIDGFGKPELGAPGRMLIGAVPTASTMTTERPDRVVAPGLMQLSGTSLAAPIVSGSAADILALHPTWTPDQVKGALMATATALPNAVPTSSGVGEISAAAAAQLADPQNPNAALEQFLVPGIRPSIDTDQWAAAAAADPAWASAYWGSAYWGSAYWGSAYWGSAYWGSAYWGSTASGAAYWGSTYLGAAYWGSSYWGSTINGASGEVDPPAPPASGSSVSSDVVP